MQWFNSRWLLIISFLWIPTTFAEQKVVIAYQTIINPATPAIATGEYEKATDTKIEWRKFDGGAAIINALASGSVQVGYLGSAPTASTTSSGVPIKLFLIASQVKSSEALVVKDSIKQPQDLLGKKIATPFVSTSHYALLAALKMWKINPTDVQLLNLNSTAINAAWQRGDIDAAYVWDPALGVAKRTGHVLIDSAALANEGFYIFDGWVARSDFIASNPDFIRQFSQVTLQAYHRFQQNPQEWLANKNNINNIVKISGVNPDDVPSLLQSNHYPSAQEQCSLLSTTIVDALLKTAQFLKEQKKLDQLLPDYNSAVTTAYLPVHEEN